MTVSFPSEPSWHLPSSLFSPLSGGSFPSAGEVRHAEIGPLASVPGGASQPLSAPNLKSLGGGRDGKVSDLVFCKT